MTDSEQLPLFDLPGGKTRKQQPAPPSAPAVITAQTPIKEALNTYLDALQVNGASIYTIKAFKSDLGLLAGWAGEDTALGDFGTRTLNDFLNWMQKERGVPCSPKTYARRVTALKNFFGYLHSNEILRRDPSNAVIQKTVNTPLPDPLTDEEVASALTACRAMRMGMFGQKPDARPMLLVLLLLETGIKKSETISLHLKDVERDDPDEARLWVRYANPKQRFKERHLPISKEWLTVLDEYIHQRQPEDLIFDKTARMLEYVLRDVSKLADIEPSKMSFETLRWTCAFRDYREGMEPDNLRQKLGISRITWSKTGEKLAQLMRGYHSDEDADHEE